jgi:hypothetical protein
MMQYEYTKEQELRDKVNGADSYEIVVRFTRSISDDLNCAGEAIKKDAPVGECLLNQFTEELQSAYDTMGMAGHFEIVSGPSVEIEHKPCGRRNHAVSN